MSHSIIPNLTVNIRRINDKNTKKNRMGTFHRNVNWNVGVTCGKLPRVLWRSQRIQINIDYCCFSWLPTRTEW